MRIDRGSCGSAPHCVPRGHGSRGRRSGPLYRDAQPRRRLTPRRSGLDTSESENLPENQGRWIEHLLLGLSTQRQLSREARDLGLALALRRLAQLGERPDDCAVLLEHSRRLLPEPLGMASAVLADRRFRVCSFDMLDS